MNVYLVIRFLHIFSSMVFVFGVILALVSGVPLFGFLQGAPQNWLLVSNVLIIVTMILVPTVFLPRGKVFGQHLEDAVRQGKVTPNLQASLHDPIVRFAHMFEIVSIVVIVILMVFKPF